MKIFWIMMAVTLAVVLVMIQIRGHFAIGGEMIIPVAVLVYLVRMEVRNEKENY